MLRTAPIPVEGARPVLYMAKSIVTPWRPYSTYMQIDIAIPNAARCSAARIWPLQKTPCIARTARCYRSSCSTSGGLPGLSRHHFMPMPPGDTRDRQRRQQQTLQHPAQPKQQNSQPPKEAIRCKQNNHNTDEGIGRTL